jgi:hypothetical protein
MILTAIVCVPKPLWCCRCCLRKLRASEMQQLQYRTDGGFHDGFLLQGLADVREHGFRDTQ